MGNYTYNKITFNAPNYQEILDTIKSTEKVFDFNTLIPEPKDLAMDDHWYAYEGVVHCVTVAFDGSTLRSAQARIWLEADPERAEKCWQYLRNIANHGSPTWLAWGYKHWNTRSNAIDGEVFVTGDRVVLEFTTINGTPFPVIEKLATMVPILEHRYMEEQPAYWGICDYKNGIIVSHRVNEDHDENHLKLELLPEPDPDSPTED